LFDERTLAVLKNKKKKTVFQAVFGF